MKSIGAEFLRPDDLPGVNHMRVTQYQTVLNITYCPELNYYSCTNLCAQFLHKTATLIYAVNRPLVASFTTYLRKGSDAILLLHHGPVIHNVTTQQCTSLPEPREETVRDV